MNLFDSEKLPRPPSSYHLFCRQSFLADLYYHGLIYKYRLNTLCRVFSEKEKPFRKNFAFFYFVRSRKMRKFFFAFFAKFRFNLFQEKMQNFREIEYTKISRKNNANILKKMVIMRKNTKVLHKNT